MSNYSAKIKELREIYTKPKDQAKLQATEKALRKAIFNQELTRHDIIRQIIKSAIEDIENINFILAHDEKLNQKDAEYDRRLLFERRDWIQLEIIDRFSAKQERDEQRKIESSIDKIKKRTDKYKNLIKKRR